MVLASALAHPSRASAQTAGAAAEPTVGADASPVDRTPIDVAEADAIARMLNCPICEGRNLVDCPLPVCAEMRNDIRARLAAGADREAIIRHFVDYYGERVRNTPPWSGLSGLAWWVPLAVLVGGVAVVVRLVRGRPSSAARPAGAPLPAGDIDYAAAIERLATAPDAEVDS